MNDRKSVAMSVDIGQKREPTAICVVELGQRDEGGRHETHFVVRHLERMPAGTTYLETAHRITEMVEGIRQRTGMGPYLYADATGLGEPVLELLRKKNQGPLQDLWGIFHAR